MALSSIPRTSTSKTLIYVAKRPSSYVRSPISHRIYVNVIQARMLWWWGRHGNHWWTSSDDHVEERVRRHQKIMRYRYSKALRRRAMWDREEQSRVTLPGRWFGAWSHLKSMSSGKPSRARIQEEEKTNDGKDRSEDVFHRDFESFKAAVDRAINIDPYGTLFGRRLQSPQYSNNSSWTSFSWFFDPKDIKDDQTNKKSEPQVIEKADQLTTDNDRRSETQSTDISSSYIRTQKSSQSEDPVESDYIFDPISMRNVPKQSHTTKTVTKKPFLEGLFSEHGVDIPVKTYKPHRVQGFDGNGAKPNTSRTLMESNNSVRFDSSRKSEFKSRLAATLGNNIDTTAEYGGKYRDTQEPIEDKIPFQRTREFPETLEDGPLYTGTTYAYKAETLQSEKARGSGWLLREGFKDANPELHESSVQERELKLQTSLDRIQEASREPALHESSKLQPSLDRYGGRIKASSAKTTRQADPYQSISQNEKAEDIDLLRASDIRAATKSVRMGKLEREIERERAKSQAREKLEKEFTAHQINADVIDSEINPSAGKLSKSLSSMWRHIRDHPQGIVAKTMQSMGMFNDNYKKYVRPSKSAVDLTEKIVFKDEALSTTPSIYDKPVRKSAPLITADLSRRAAYLENEANDRRISLQQANEKSRLDQEAESSRASKLADDLRTLYETEYGTIDANHRQMNSGNLKQYRSDYVRGEQLSNTKQSTELHPLQTASRKPGISRDIIIEAHVSSFEPKLAQLIDSTKAVRRELHEAQQHIRALQSHRPPTNWNSIDPTMVQSSEKPETSEEAAQSYPSANSSLRTVQLLPEKEEHLVEISSLKPDNSTHVILAYDHKTGKVEATRANVRYMDTQDAINPIKALAQLLNSSEFVKYFASLEQLGYELVSGGLHTLVFQKKGLSNVTPKETLLNVDRAIADSSHKIQAPNPTEFSQGTPSNTTNSDKHAAVVLDQIPPEIEPSPGPSAPIPPPASPITSNSRQSKVTRQEDVFSGTIRPGLDSSAGEQKTKSDPTTASEKGSMWTKIARGTRRVILTITGLGVTAYVIGFIAEGVGAQSQQRKAVDDGNASGPRKRIVMTGQRSGIYSTESSR